MYRTVAPICTAQWSLYVPHSGPYMYRTEATICTAQWPLYVPHSGHYMYRPVVTICTAQWSLYVPPGLTFTNSPFCPHSVFMCFVWIWDQTAIISLSGLNCLVGLTETECVYCAVRTGYLKCNSSQSFKCDAPNKLTTAGFKHAQRTQELDDNLAHERDDSVAMSLTV
jgi:hypothetical protein